MTDQYTPFGADDIDEQIDLYTQMLHATSTEETPAPDLRLIDDLQHFYPADEATARSLARVRQRLLSGAPSVSQGGQRAGPSGRRRSLAERRQRMRFPRSLFHTGQKVSYRIVTIAAAVLLVLVIGSLAAGLVLVHHGNANTGQHSNPQGTPATATSVPEPSSVYVTSNAGLYKVDAKTGKQLWHFDGPSYYIVVAGGVVYSTAQGGELMALDASTGQVRWQSSAMSANTGAIHFTVANGVIYAGSAADGYLYALDASNGQVLWHANVVPSSAAKELPFFSGIQVVNGVLYGSFGLQTSPGPIYGYLYAARAKDGSVLWQTPGPTDQFIGGPVFVDGVLYTTSSEISHHSASEAQDSYAYAFDPQTGKMLWQSQKTKGFVFGQPAVGDGGVYFGAQDDSLYAVKATDGSPLWRYQTGESFYGTPQVVGDVVYAGETSRTANHNFLVALNAKNGAVLWKHEFAFYDGMGNFAVGDGVLYIAAGEGARITTYLYALNLKDGSVLWKTPYGSGDLGGESFDDSVCLAP